MSYNGIGLSTARGSGTNGYVQRNLSTLRPRERTRDNQPIDDRPPPMRKANKEILDHAKKRQIELQCAVLQDDLEARGDVSEDEIDAQVDKLRQELLGNLERMTQDVKTLQEHQVHELAEAKEKADARAREAFGIGKDFVAGAAFDRDLQARLKQDKTLERQRREEEREQRAAERAAEMEKRKKEMAKKAQQDAKRAKADEADAMLGILVSVQLHARRSGEVVLGRRAKSAAVAHHRHAHAHQLQGETAKTAKSAGAAEDRRARSCARQTPAGAEMYPVRPSGVAKVGSSRGTPSSLAIPLTHANSLSLPLAFNVPLTRASSSQSVTVAFAIDIALTLTLSITISFASSSPPTEVFAQQLGIPVPVPV
ncbi:hypothetical protein HDU87_005510 [Geranomyces variabilis]|uniref:CWF21 domain-containing protein n=1 Tax=Geranomyces variabilis TaxID=109894 RepID=A0AAD5TIH1_9FUNG|nr:hypothetical protein HDU87_005510 [Geranomyces variabilis]